MQCKERSRRPEVASAGPWRPGTLGGVARATNNEHGQRPTDSCAAVFCATGSKLPKFRMRRGLRPKKISLRVPLRQSLFLTSFFFFAGPGQASPGPTFSHPCPDHLPRRSHVAPTRPPPEASPTGPTQPLHPPSRHPEPPPPKTCLRSIFSQYCNLFSALEYFASMNTPTGRWRARHNRAPWGGRASGDRQVHCTPGGETANAAA